MSRIYVSCSPKVKLYPRNTLHVVSYHILREKKLEQKNAIVIYSSDHGFSLGENGFFGNASKDPLAQKEQTDIAMFMWLSDYFIKKNPAIANTTRFSPRDVI